MTEPSNYVKVMRFGGKLWISQLLGLNIISKSTYFQLLLKMSVLLEEQQVPTRLSWRTLGVVSTKE